MTSIDQIKELKPTLKIELLSVTVMSIAAWVVLGASLVIGALTLTTSSPEPEGQAASISLRMVSIVLGGVVSWSVLIGFASMIKSLLLLREEKQ